MLRRTPSLRFRLTLYYVGVFITLQVLLLGTVAILRRSASESYTKLQLEEDARAIIDNVVTAQAFTGEQLRANQPLASRMLFVFLRDEDGNVLAKLRPTDDEAQLPPLEAHDEEGAPPEDREKVPPLEARERVPAGPIGPNHTTLPPSTALAISGREERLLMLTYPFEFEQKRYYLQAAAKDPGLARYLGPFFDLVVIGVPVGVLAAIIAAWTITDRALRPLDRLVAAARAVSPNRLGARLPTSGDAELLKLAEELNSALEQIEAAYKAQDQFLGNVAHELKTPLAVLLLQAQVARLGKRDDAEAWAFLRAAEEELKRLSVVVESFLVLARARAAGPDRPRERIGLNDLVVQSVHNEKRQAEERGVRLVANLGAERDSDEDEPELEGDPDLLQTMLDNLVRNAVAHSPTGEVVAIDASYEGDELVLAVRDRGPGIPVAFRRQVFERFVQVPRRQAESPEATPGTPRGTGLGLAIAHDVARMHGGRIEIADREGGGTTLLIILPAASENGA